MTDENIIFYQNLMSFSGIVVLAIPTFSLNFRKKSLAKIVAIVARRKAKGDRGALDEIAAELKTRKEQQAGRWRGIDEKCLYLGYFLLLGSMTWRLLG